MSDKDPKLSGQVILFKKDNIEHKDKTTYDNKIISHSPTTLQNILCDNRLLPEISGKSVSKEDQFCVVRNISGYLSELGAECAVIERDYVDGDYLDDYVRYYSRCYSNYERKCCRIHFFSKRYEQSEIDEILSPGNDSKSDYAFEEFAKTYLGFVVIRPIPTALVGRTCLKIYPRSSEWDNEGTRHYKALRDVDVSFFGRKLTVRCMPFMQQDKTTAVCAGCALWSAFQVTAQLFKHKFYCPGSITSMALGHGMYEKRNFPNGGLFSRDMLYAIRGVELEPISIVFDYSFDKDKNLRNCLGSIYAYLNAGLPIILTGSLFETDKNGNLKERGVHAVTINGYHLLDQFVEPFSHYVSDRIDKIYVNDDGVGPCSRMKLDRNMYVWETDWIDKEASKPDCVVKQPMVVHQLLIPAYHKIRVDYEMIIRHVDELEMEIRSALDKFGDEKYAAFRPCCYSKYRKGTREWDIRLLANKDFKAEVRNDFDLKDCGRKLGVLKKGYPKFIWNISLFVDCKRDLRFIVDATDTGDALCVLDAFRYADGKGGVMDGMALIFKIMSLLRMPNFERERILNNPLLRKLLED